MLRVGVDFVPPSGKKPPGSSVCASNSFYHENSLNDIQVSLCLVEALYTLQNHRRPSNLQLASLYLCLTLNRRLPIQSFSPLVNLAPGC